MQKPLIIAHRGASYFAPENTLMAFRRAIADGAEGLEFDVQLAKDGVPVIIHDFDLKRLGRCAGKVNEFSSEQLRKLDVGTWFNLRHKAKADERFSAETVPTFSELLEFLKDFKGLLYVELKFADGAVEKLVETACELILKNAFLPNIKLKSFNLKAIKHAKENFPEISTVALFEPEFRTVFRKRTSIFEAAETYLADELSLHYSLATRKTVEKAKARNLPVTIWTVDQIIWINRAMDLGIEAIISNNPAQLLAEKRRILTLTQ
ncbi:glycerophosphodiester phosphodiesterase [soil metagenome]